MKSLNRSAVVVLLATSAAFAQISNIVVTSAASFELGMPNQGSIAAIFCTGLQVEGIVTAETLPLPLELAGVKVWVGGVAAPLFAVAAGQGFQQINIQVPKETQFATDRGVEVVIEQDGRRGTEKAWQRWASPGDFFRWPGTNLGIFQHWPDYSLVTEDNPARPGEILITYLTGMMGYTEPAVPTGEPSPFDPPACVPRLDNPLLFDRIGVYEAGHVDLSTDKMTLWVGLTPGLVGVYQVNFVVPESFAGGTKQVLLARVRYSHFPPVSEVKYSSPVLLPVR